MISLILYNRSCLSLGCLHGCAVHDCWVPGPGETQTFLYFQVCIMYISGIFVPVWSHFLPQAEALSGLWWNFTLVFCEHVFVYSSACVSVSIPVWCGLQAGWAYQQVLSVTAALTLWRSRPAALLERKSPELASHEAWLALDSQRNFSLT